MPECVGEVFCHVDLCLEDGFRFLKETEQLALEKGCICSSDTTEI